MKKIVALLFICITGTGLIAPLCAFGADDKGITELGKRKRGNPEQDTNKKRKEEQIEEKKIEGKKTIEIEGDCPICQEELKKYPTTVVHSAPTSKTDEIVDHILHTHCLIQYLRENGDKKYLCQGLGQTDYDPINDEIEDEINEFEAADTTIEHDLGMNAKFDEELTPPMKCAICRTPFTTTYGELRKNYRIYLDRLTLKERFLQLDELPIKYALQTLQCYEVLKKDVRLQICSTAESAIILQKFAIKKADIWITATEQNAGLWAGHKHLDECHECAIGIAVKLLEDSSITPEFVRLMVRKEYFQEADVIETYFKCALNSKMFLMPAGAFCGERERTLANIDLLVQKTLPKNTLPEEIASIQNRALVRMAEVCLPRFTEEAKEKYFFELLKRASSPSDKRYVTNKLLSVLPQKLGFELFVRDYEQLNIKTKMQLFPLFMKDLTDLKGEEYVKTATQNIYNDLFKDTTKTAKRCREFSRTFKQNLQENDPRLLLTALIGCHTSKEAGILLGEKYQENDANQITVFKVLLNKINTGNTRDKALQGIALILYHCSVTNKKAGNVFYEVALKDDCIKKPATPVGRDIYRMDLFDLAVYSIKPTTLEDKEALFMATANAMETSRAQQFFICKQFGKYVDPKKQLLLYYFTNPSSLNPRRNQLVKMTLEGAVPQNYFTGLQNFTSPVEQLETFKKLWPKLQLTERYQGLLLALTHLHPDNRKQILEIAPLQSWFGACTLIEKIGCLFALCRLAGEEQKIMSIIKDTIACCNSDNEKESLLLASNCIIKQNKNNTLSTLMLFRPLSSQNILGVPQQQNNQLTPPSTQRQ